jgi:hypothetical protein
METCGGAAMLQVMPFHSALVILCFVASKVLLTKKWRKGTSTDKILSYQ